MNKKLLYGMLFTSIFILSSVALLAKPALGAKWSFGVPNEAKGIETESEVKVYDKSDWGHALGNNPDDRCNQKHGNYREGYSSNADDVGARTKSKILDWEKDDIWLLGDHLLYTKLDESIRQDASYDRTGDGISDLITYWDAITFAHMTVKGLANHTDTIGTLYNKPLIYMVFGIAYQEYLNGNVTFANFSLMQTVQNLAWVSSYNRTTVSALYGKEYKGYILERDLWYWADNGDYESDPDEDEVETPFIEDPDDVVDSYWYFYGMTEVLFAQIQAIVDAYTTFIGSVGWSAGLPGGTHTYNDGSDWDALNTTLYTTVYNLYLADPVNYGPLWFAITLPPPIGANGDAVYGIYAAIKLGLEVDLIDFFRSKVPDKAEYLITILRAGIPAHQSVDKWLERLVDGFDIPDDVYYGGTDDNFLCDVSVDEMQVTIEIEWADGVMWNPGAAVPEERDDYEMVFLYSDTGSQSSMTYQNGDIFYKTESLAPVIPGYEISILLGAAAISAISLIYVVMKKRRM
ncbi:MAG: hypothetical protein ACFE8A_11265 [Candidatus Hodarchaeota archaeon]